MLHRSMRRRWASLSRQMAQTCIASLSCAPCRHHQRHVYCPDIGVPVLKTIASARTFQRCVAHAHSVSVATCMRWMRSSSQNVALIHEVQVGSTALTDGTEVTDDLVIEKLIDVKLNSFEPANQVTV